MASELVMRKFLYVSICIVLFLGAMWLIKQLIVGISPNFGYGFTSGVAVTILLIYSAEKLGYKEPRY